MSDQPQDEQRFDYDDGSTAFQRKCDADGCDRGLIYGPVRFCGKCSGTGFLVRWERTLPTTDNPLGKVEARP